MFSFSENFLQYAYIIFQNSVDNIEIAHKTCSILVRGAPPAIMYICVDCQPIMWPTVLQIRDGYVSKSLMINNLQFKGVLHLLPQKAQKLVCFVLHLKIINIFLKNNICILQ